MHTYLAVRKLLKIIPVEGTYHNITGDEYITRPLQAVPLTVEFHGNTPDESLKDWQARIIEDGDKQRIIGVRYHPRGVQKEITKQDIPIPSIGITSGGRSAIVQNVHIFPCIGFHGVPTGPLYKIKGCRLSSQQYLLSAADIVEPEGAQSAEQAEYEFERTTRVNELLINEGIISPIEPCGWFEYEQKVGEQRAGALVAKIRGDLRLDEVIRRIAEQGNSFEYLRKYRHRIGIALEEFLYEIGRNAGKTKRIYDDLGFAWGKNSSATNNHIGNFVIYKAEKGRVRVGMVDLDGQQPRKSRLKRIQEKEKESLEKQLRNALHVSGPREENNHQTIINNNQAGPIAARGFSDGYRTRRAGIIPTSHATTMLKFIYSQKELLRAFVQLYILSDDHTGMQVLNKNRKRKIICNHSEGWHLIDGI